jgi:hypothetical protein
MVKKVQRELEREDISHSSIWLSNIVVEERSKSRPHSKSYLTPHGKRTE